MDELGNLPSRVASWLNMVPSWVYGLLLIAAAALAASFIHSLLFRIAQNAVAGRDLFWRSLVARTRGPTRLASILAGVGFAAGVAPLTWNQGIYIAHGMLIGLIALAGWMTVTALHIWTTVYLRRFKLDSEDNLLARKHVTQSRILKRVADILIWLITLSAALMTFDDVRQYGVSLLASAGAAGIVVGLALQPLLKNLVAGVQLAVTQPIRIEDSLLVEGEWGNVEEITSTYVVLRLWDWRRLILPLSYFIEHPFQNWTRDGAALIGTVMLYVDYLVPVDDMRAELERIARASPLWDGKVVNLQVTDFRESTMEVRMLVSAGSAPKTFDLRCEVRERIIAWLQSRHPDSLPRMRTELLGPIAGLGDGGGRPRGNGGASGRLDPIPA